MLKYFCDACGADIMKEGVLQTAHFVPIDLLNGTKGRVLLQPGDADKQFCAPCMVLAFNLSGIGKRAA